MTTEIFYHAVTETLKAYNLIKEDALHVLDLYIATIYPNKVCLEDCLALHEYVDEKYSTVEVKYTLNEIFASYRNMSVDNTNLLFEEFCSIAVYECPKILQTYAYAKQRPITLHGYMKNGDFVVMKDSCVPIED